MYLTRLILNPRSAQARRDLADAYDMHRTLSRAFLKDDAEQPMRFLWRVERDTNAWTHPTVLVQSRHSGVWDSLQSLSGYLQKPAEIKTVQLDRYVQAGAYRFRLMANPTVTQQGKRCGLMDEEAQLEWLKRQGARHGFIVQASVVCASNLMESNRKPGSNITVRQVCFEGVLNVQEPSSVRNALLNGIGPAKAFGCGLLSLAQA